MKLIKSLILSLAVLVGFSSTSNARDITLSMWTHNQLYVDYFNTYLEEVQAAFPVSYTHLTLPTTLSV